MRSFLLIAMGMVFVLSAAAGETLSAPVETPYSLASASPVGDRDSLLIPDGAMRTARASVSAEEKAGGRSGKSRSAKAASRSTAPPSDTRNAPAGNEGRPNEGMTGPLDEARREARLPEGNVVDSGKDAQGSASEVFRRLEIEVSHSRHYLRLLAESPSGEKMVLHKCGVGLGGPGFPTPVGEYYVTHIYDENPWWIPPKDRAWAAGDSPSQRVYGGTMAPLLKKRPVRTKKAVAGEAEDMVDGEVKLDDYGYRFHGTNAPRSIGRNQSHGCVRMLPADAGKVAGLIKEHVGVADRRESENGPFVVLKAPVRLNLVK
jgi:lipoprotein-anchoring transpeptidase ErfK/SrfK